ncbi:MAG: hypothetical protein R3F56_17910 [Planctomycetota bacterium]
MAVVLTVCAAAALAVQAPIPNPHWGAAAFPRDREEVRLSLSFNRFTELDGEGRRFNDIEQSAGFDMLSVAYNRELLDTSGARWTLTFDAGAGVSNDQPTEFLQNDYIHRFRHLDRVPTDGVRRGPEFLAGLAATRWFGAGEARDEPMVDDRDLRFSGLLGAGLATSTLYHEMFAHVGGSMYSPRYHVRAEVVDRMCLCTGGDAYPDVAPFTNLTQVSLYYVPRSYFMGPSGSLGEVFDEALRWRNLWPWNWPKAIHDLGGRPEIGVHVTYDTGLFLNERGQEIDTWFISLSMEWPTGLRLETWNDMANGTDFGPTYGMMISFDLSTLWRTTLR